MRFYKTCDNAFLWNRFRFTCMYMIPCSFQLLYFNKTYSPLDVGFQVVGWVVVNIKISYQHRNSHYKDKTRPSNLFNENLSTWEEGFYIETDLSLPSIKRIFYCFILPPKVVGGMLDSPRVLSFRLSVIARRQCFRSVNRVCFRISISISHARCVWL